MSVAGGSTPDRGALMLWLLRHDPSECSRLWDEESGRRGQKPGVNSDLCPSCTCAPPPAPLERSSWDERPYLQQPACLHGPDKDLEGVLGPGTDDLPAGVHRHAGELGGPRGREGAEVPVPAAEREAQLTLLAEAPAACVFRVLNVVAPSRASVHTTGCPTIPEPSASLTAQQRNSLLWARD